MSYFLFKLTPPRPTFPQDMTPVERDVMQAHSAYWSALANKGIAIVVGPVADPAGAWGVAVVEVADETAARALADSDPVTKSGLAFQYDIFPMLQALLRK
jgi:uncharacterized protein YciI